MTRFLFAFACVLSLPVVGSAGHRGVHVIDVQRLETSAREVRITTLRDGKALSNVRLDFYFEKEPAPKMSVVTDQRGVGVSPKLAVGYYRVDARDPESVNEHAQLLLDVSDGKPPISSLSMIIPPVYFPGVRLSDVEATPISERIQEFAGVVEDQSGAFVPDSSVQVFRKERPFEAAAKIVADSEGKFSLRLPSGTYVAFATAAGFGTSVIGFSIDRRGDSKPLKFVLRVDGLPDTVSVTGEVKPN